MDPEEIRSRVAACYDAAMAQSALHQRTSPMTQNLLHGARLFGREAGYDFVETHIDTFVRDAVEAAECRQSSLTFAISGSGRAAIEGMVEALRDLTHLSVQASQATVMVSWRPSLRAEKT